MTAATANYNHIQSRPMRFKSILSCCWLRIFSLMCVCVWYNLCRVHVRARISLFVGLHWTCSFGVALMEIPSLLAEFKVNWRHCSRKKEYHHQQLIYHSLHFFDCPLLLLLPLQLSILSHKALQWTATKCMRHGQLGNWQQAVEDWPGRAVHSRLLHLLSTAPSSAMTLNRCGTTTTATGGAQRYRFDFCKTASFTVTSASLVLSVLLIQLLPSVSANTQTTIFF